MYSLEMQVLAEGRWLSSAGLMVTLGMGWNPSSLAGRAGDPEQIIWGLEEVLAVTCDLSPVQK